MKKKPHAKGSYEELIILFVILFIIGSIGTATIRYSVDRVLSVAPQDLGLAAAQQLQFMLAASWVLVGVFVWILVSELLKSRKRLARDRATLETFLNSAGDGIFAIDRDFVITLWNKRAAEITGHAAADVVGQPLRDVMVFHRERDREEDIVFVEEAMLYGETRSMGEPMYMSRKDGKEVPVGDSAAPLFDVTGDVVGCVVVFRDATAERKQQSLRSEFAYASHQLKTPVTKALWSLEATLDKPAPEKKDLEIAIGALQSIRKLSKEIVEVAEIDQNIVSVKLGAVSLRDALAQTEEELETCKKDHGVTIDVSGVPDGLMVESDMKLLRRILTELICNAIIYSQSGSTVAVSATQDDAKVTIEIRDEGIGIPDDEQALVFSKFFRGSNLDTTSMSGAGLGTYIAKRYVERLRGHVWFKSTEGSGSSFYVSLRPAKKVDVQIAKKP